MLFRRSRHYIRLWLPAIFILALALSPAGFQGIQAKAAAPAPDPSSPFGVAGVMRWPDWGTFNKPADAMLATGGAWVREDFAWGLIEPRQGHQDWTATDRIVSTLRERKLNVLGIIAYSVNWATPTTDDDKSQSATSFYPPDGSKYYWFVRGLVTRYKDSVHAWEVWNEPNNSLFWKPAPSAKEYAALLKVAYKAVKDADPSAKVLTGGMSGNAVPFLEEMIADGAGDSFDILALHPYAVPLDDSQGKAQSRPEEHKMVDIELSKYKAFLERHSYNRPIWVTEVGWPAHDWQLDEQSQADYLAQAYAQMLASGIPERIFWYSFKDGSANPSDTWGLTAWGTGSMDLAARRPAFAAYSTSAHLLTGTRPAGRLQPGPFDLVDTFEQPATWTRSTNPNGTFSITTQEKHGGTSSGNLQYSFASPNQAVDFAPPSPLPLPGKPTRLGLWVKGDASGDYLSAWLKDRDGELFEVRLGAVTGAADGWRYYESSINNYYFDWEHTGGNPSNGTVDYPVNFVSFRLENTPDEPAGSGTIYVDDLQSFDGPDVSAVRFSRGDGQVVDVLWSVAPAQISLPTHSAHATIVDRDGAAHTVDASNGALPLSVSSKPIYVIHQPADPAGGQQPVGGEKLLTGAPGSQEAAPGDVPECAAAAHAAASNDAGTRYFAETGHNLSEPFKSYWEQHGGLAVLGYPVTEAFTAASSDGKEYKQQYFERARMEYHPENKPPQDVQLGLLGIWTTTGRAFPRLAPPASGPAIEYFGETGHTIQLFKTWWEDHGGVAVFGFPISDEVQEKNSADGKTYTVQYFERNRLEYHPEYAGSNQQVLLGLLGVEYLKGKGCK